MCLNYFLNFMYSFDFSVSKINSRKTSYDYYLCLSYFACLSCWKSSSSKQSNLTHLLMGKGSSSHKCKIYVGKHTNINGQFCVRKSVLDEIVGGGFCWRIRKSVILFNKLGFPPLPVKVSLLLPLPSTILMACAITNRAMSKCPPAEEGYETRHER